MVKQSWIHDEAKALLVGVGFVIGSGYRFAPH
jgi:hypothetical protein